MLDFPGILGTEGMHVITALFTPVYPFTILHRFLAKTTNCIQITNVIILNKKMKSVFMKEYLDHILVFCTRCMYV